MDSYSKKIEESMNDVYNTLDVVLKKGAYLLTPIPYVGSILYGVVEAIMDRTKKYNSVLASKIVNTAEQLILENNINQFAVAMKHINRTLNRIAQNQAIHEDGELANIRRDLEHQIESFDLKDGVYRKYPILSINSLFVLSAYVIAFDMVLKEKKPHLVQHSQLACDLNRIILEYRQLLVQQRLDLIDVSGSYWFSVKKAKKIKAKLVPIVAGYTYSAGGYYDEKRILNGRIGCVKTKQAKCIPSRMMFIQDSEESYYDAAAPNNIEKCLADYMRFTRREVERFCDRPLTSTDLMCTIENTDTNSISEPPKGNKFHSKSE